MYFHQDVSLDVVISRANTIATILSDPEQVSVDALYNCSAALVATITEFSSLCASDGSIDNILQSLSAVVSHGKSLPVPISQQISKVVDVLAAAKGRLLIPGESIEMVVNNLRFYSGSNFVSNTKGSSFTSPQTPIEKFTGVRPATMKFTNTRLSSIHRKLSIVEYDSSILKRELSGDGDGAIGGDGSVVQVSVSQSNVNYLPGRSPNSTAEKVYLAYDTDPGENTIIVTIPNNAPISYYDYKPENGSVHCAKKGHPYSVSANCTLAPELNVTCPGNDTRTLTFICPGKTLAPVCLAWNGVDYVVSSACYVLSFTPYNTTCACVGPTGYNEELGEISTSNPQIASIAASADLIVSGFVDTWKSADNITPNSLTKNKVR